MVLKPGRTVGTLMEGSPPDRRWRQSRCRRDHVIGASGGFRRVIDLSSGRDSRAVLMRLSISVQFDTVGNVR